MRIQAEQLPTGEYRALDLDEYEAESDVNGWWSCSLVGYGATKEAALADLLAEIEDRAEVQNLARAALEPEQDK